jgi:hypothetical protein
MSLFPFIVREHEHEFDPELGLLAPVPQATGADAVHPEPLDGDRPMSFHCTALTLRMAGEDKPLLRMNDLRLRTTVTDGRITFACSKYDKGGGWFGGLSAIALNAGSMALAAHRRRGKMLVGHLRYPWLLAVYAQNRQGWLSSERLRIFFLDEGERMQLDLDLPKDVDATTVATELIHRAAAFRLAHEPELDDEERAKLGELAQLAPLVDPPGSSQMAGVEFPSAWSASERSARFGMGAPATPAAPADDEPLVILRSGA